MGLFERVHNLDFVATLFLIGILTFVGANLIDRRPPLREWGKRMAYATLLLYVLVGFLQLSPDSAEEWIALTLRGLMAAGLVLGAAWVILPASSTIYDHTIGAAGRKLREWSSRARAMTERRRHEREREAARRRSDEEYRRGAPDRERAKQEAEARSSAEVAAQKRRVDTRARCEFAYSTFAHDIRKRFTPRMYDEFIANYMTDQFALDDWRTGMVFGLRGVRVLPFTVRNVRGVGVSATRGRALSSTRWTCRHVASRQGS